MSWKTYYFENGSKITSLPSKNNIRGKRSELIGFYCVGCEDVHEDYPMKKLAMVDNDMWMCKESFDVISKEIQKEIPIQYSFD